MRKFDSDRASTTDPSLFRDASARASRAERIPSLGRRIVGVTLMACASGTIFFACSSGDSADQQTVQGVGSGGSSGKGSGDSGTNNVPADGSIFTQAGLDAANAKPDSAFDPDAFWANDPPPQTCGDSGNVQPVVPGGTPDCPDDKNREGCACSPPGIKAACWPGFRKNRNRGICKDGQTTCENRGENSGAWGPCEGYVLPQPGAVGAQACECFSAGTWAIDNLIPCFWGGSPTGSGGAVSTVKQSDGSYACPAGGTLPTTPWSTDSLTVDCAGHFKLCYTLKAYDDYTNKKPASSDCTMGQICVEGDYVKANVKQDFPPLGAWKGDDAASKACAEKFAATGGYGEMSVSGLSVECDNITDHVFHTVDYCPLKCNDSAHASDPECQNCGNGGDGGFGTK
jgi:hypothetical protein